MEQEQKTIYSEPAIEFVKSAVETCLILEQAGQTTREDFVEKMTKVLPLVYLKLLVIREMPLSVVDGFNERFVTENDYLFVKNGIEVLLGEDDLFLEVFHPDMPYSDTPIAVTISENLADIYQELKEMVASYRIGEEQVMEMALYECVEAFSEHWGRKLLNALRAIHNIQFGEKDDEMEGGDRELNQTVNRNDFFDFLNEE